MATRAKVAKKMYSIGGEWKKHAEPGIEALRIEFYDPDYSGDEADRPLVGEVLEVKASDLNGLPENIREVIGWHGLSQKLGDAYANASKAKENAWDMAAAMWEALTAGTWVEKGESAGPRSSLLLEAMERVAKNAGINVTAELRAQFAASIDTPEKKKAAKGDPLIASALAEIDLERTRERAKKAAAAAKGAGGESGFLSAIMGGGDAE